MIKKLLGMVAVAAILVSCGNKDQKKEEAGCDKDVAKVTVEQVLEDFAGHVDKKIVVVGTVNHVCKHGGKRMFIIGENPDLAIKIVPSEDLGTFEKELEGSHVMITGTVKELRIDEAYVAGIEAELAEGGDHEAVHDHSGGTHEEHEVTEEQKQQIQAMRDKIAETEKGYYSQFWIEASKYEVKECDHDHEGHDHDHEGDDHDHEGHDHDHDHAEGEEHTH